MYRNDTHVKSYHEAELTPVNGHDVMAKYHLPIPRKDYFPSLRGRGVSTWGSEILTR